MGGTVVVCVSDDEFARFLAPEVAAHAAGLTLERCARDDGAEGIIAALRRTGAQALLTAWSTPALPVDLLERAPQLRYLCHVCGGIRGLVPRALIERGLLVSNWGPTVARVVAEHCLLQILAGLRNLAACQLAMHVEGGWAPSDAEGRSLYGRSVGLHGFGHIAREVVRLLAPFACRISAFAPGDADEELTTRGVARSASLDDLYAGNDVVACLAPLLPSTRGSVTEALLSRLRAGALFVNTGRGAVVDEAALARIASEGRIRVALDVFEVEPLPLDSPLRGLRNVLLTPHIAGPTPDRQRDCGAYAFANLRAFFAGGSVRSLIDTAQYDRQT